MAEQISKIKRMEIPPEVEKQQNIDEVINKVSENKDAIVSGIDLLATLQKNGSLDMLHAFIKHKEEALENVMSVLNKPRYANVLENMVQLLMLTGEIKVDELHHFTEKLNRGLEEARTGENMEKTSYMSLLTALKDPEINRSITILLQFLKGMGRE